MRLSRAQGLEVTGAVGGAQEPALAVPPAGGGEQFLATELLAVPGEQPDAGPAHAHVVRQHLGDPAQRRRHFARGHGPIQDQARDGGALAAGAFLARQQGLFGLLAGGDVRQHREGPEELPVGIVLGSRGDAHPAPAPLGVAVAALEGIGRARAPAFHRCQPVGGVLRPQEVGQRTPEHLARPVAEHLFQAVVHKEGPGLGIEAPDALMGRLDDPAVPFLALAQCLLDPLPPFEVRLQLGGPRLDLLFEPGGMPAETPGGAIEGQAQTGEGQSGGGEPRPEPAAILDGNGPHLHRPPGRCGVFVAQTVAGAGLDDVAAGSQAGQETPGCWPVRVVGPGVVINPPGE